MNVKVDACRVTRISVVLLRDEDQEPVELWIAIERADALENIAIENLEDFSCHNYLAAYKPRSARCEVVVDDRIQLA